MFSKIKNQLKKECFLPSITTTEGSNWKEKIKEVKELGLKESALFLTCLKQKERKILYKLLEKSCLERIPFVHLRNDMELWELDYLVKKHKTQAFNIHAEAKYPLIYDYSKYRDVIYVENTTELLIDEDIKDWAGVCLDFSHLEKHRIEDKKRFESDIKLIEKYGVGANHISSSVRSISRKNPTHHYLEDFSGLDYLKNYPLKYFSRFIALELENSLKEQLKAIDYIVKLIDIRYYFSNCKS